MRTVSRVCGELSVSRALGDRDFKGIGTQSHCAARPPRPPEEDFFWPEGHPGAAALVDDLVLADPEVGQG